MRIDQLNVVLRARSGWEAMELGTALVRRHAVAIWTPWLLLALPVFVALNTLAWWADAFALAWLAMWWLKPLFERVALYVISRGVFGETPGTLDTLRAQRHWGWQGFWGYLGWRRPSPMRTVMLPVNLLEGADPVHRRDRRRAILNGTLGHSLMLTLVAMTFEVVLVVGAIAGVFMLVPFEQLPDSWRAAWAMVGEDTPAWAKLCFNLLCWAAATLIGPFHVGAGFGLYLNRRTEMEAWDVEIAFRRLRERLSQAAPLLMLALVLAWPAGVLHAQQAPPADTVDDTAPDTDTTGGDADVQEAQIRERIQKRREGGQTPPRDAPSIFGNDPVDTAGFRQAVERAYEDPLQHPTRTVTEWRRIPEDAADKKKKKKKELDARPTERSARTKTAAQWSAQIAEWGLWAFVGVLVVILLLTIRRWLPWLRGSGRRRREKEATPVQEDAITLPDVVPPDVATRARALWQQGRPRQALALLYRASVESMSERAQVSLPPGATEAQCLRAARRMPDEGDRTAFARVVRVWQYAAYAGRLPDDAEFDALAGSLREQFRWQA